MIRLFGLVICTRRQWKRELDGAFDVAYACGKIDAKLQMGRLTVDDPDRQLCERPRPRRLRVVR